MFDEHLKGGSCPLSVLHWSEDVLASHSFSCLFNKINIPACPSCHLRLLNHFFLLSRCRSLPCEHFGNFALCLLWTSWTWLSNDSHLACTSSLSSSGVVDTHQYRWLMILFCHSLTNSQSFCFPSFSNFLWNPRYILQLCRCTSIIIIYTFCYVPCIK